MKITEAELALRKEQIIHAAFKLFCKYGIEKVTIKDIAKAAKLSESSIYRYYENKAYFMAGNWFRTGEKC